MKAFIINMPENLTRRHNMVAEMAKTPFSHYEFVDGVNGRAMSDNERRKEFDYDAFVQLNLVQPSPGEVGCALAHRRAWEKVAAGGEPVFVFEDDVTFSGEDWKDITDYAHTWLNSPNPRVLLLNNWFFSPTLQHAGRLQVGTPIYLTVSAYAYAINPAGARFLYDLGRPHFVADAWDYYARRGLQIKDTCDHPVTQSAQCESTIGLHTYENLDWNAASRIVQPTPYIFFHELDFIMILLSRLRIFHHVKKI